MWPIGLIVFLRQGDYTDYIKLSKLSKPSEYFKTII